MREYRSSNRHHAEAAETLNDESRSTHERVSNHCENADDESRKARHVSEFSVVDVGHGSEFGCHKRGNTERDLDFPAGDHIAGEVLDVPLCPNAERHTGKQVRRGYYPIDGPEIHPTNTCFQNWRY